MSDTERAELIERLVRASDEPEYAQEARGWSLDQLRAAVAEWEAAAADVRRYGHLGAVWRADARDHSALLRRR